MIHSLLEFVKWAETDWHVHAMIDLWLILSICGIMATKVDKKY